MLSEDYILEVTPEKLLDTCLNSMGEMEVLLNWHQLQDVKNSWKSAEAIKREFPDRFGRGNDRFGLVYKRRNN